MFTTSPLANKCSERIEIKVNEIKRKIWEEYASFCRDAYSPLYEAKARILKTIVSESLSSGTCEAVINKTRKIEWDGEFGLSILNWYLDVKGYHPTFGDSKAYKLVKNLLTEYRKEEEKNYAIELKDISSHHRRIP